jgi:hypothetical protein
MQETVDIIAAMPIERQACGGATSDPPTRCGLPGASMAGWHGFGLESFLGGAPVVLASNFRDVQPSPMQADAAASSGVVNAMDAPAAPRRWLRGMSGKGAHAVPSGLRLRPHRRGAIWERAIVRYAIAVVSVGAAIGAINLVEAVTGSASGVVVVVSHGDVIRSALLFALGMPLDSYNNIEIGQGSISSIRIDAGGWLS